MTSALHTLTYQLAGINPTSTDKVYLEEITKLVELSQSSPLFHSKNHTEEERAELHSWITFSHSKITSEELTKFDSILLKKSYLIGNRFTIADILVFAAFHEQKLIDAAISLVNVSRWFDHIQHLVIPSVVPLTPISHRAFVFPWLEATAAASTPLANVTDDTKTPVAPAAVVEKKVADNAKKEDKVENKPKPEKKGDKKEKEQTATTEKKEERAKSVGDSKTATTEKKEETAKSVGDSKTEEVKTVSAEGLDPSKLEIRVGLIVKCWNHPESEKLLCEEIDLGEGSTRTIASGLRSFYTAEEMQGRKVLVLANLKERPMAGFKSQGMVLCAVGEGHSIVKLLEPPATATVGDRVDIAGFSGEPAPATQVAKKKIFESLAPFFRTNASGLPTWNNIPFTIKGELCGASLANAVVS